LSKISPYKGAKTKTTAAAPQKQTSPEFEPMLPLLLLLSFKCFGIRRLGRGW